MRKIAAVMTVAACACAAAPARAVDIVDKAIEAAAAEAIAKLDPAKLGDVKSAAPGSLPEGARRYAVAVLPLWKDKSGHAEDMVKAAVTQRGVRVLARSAKEWSLLLGEIEWNVKREDVMDAATIQRFGKIQGCDGVLYGTLRETGEEQTPVGRRGVARLSLHIADVETGQIVWSSGPVQGEFVDKRGFVERIVVRPPFWITVGGLVLLAVVVLVIRRAARPR